MVNALASLGSAAGARPGSGGDIASEAAAANPAASPMQIAEGLLGRGEVPDHGLIQEFLTTGGAGMDPATQAWCATFVNASLSQAGIEGTGSPAARSFLRWGEPVDEPRRGDLAVLSRGDPNGWQGHVGFFDRVNPDGTIRLLGGNQGDAVSYADYDASRLLGYRRAPETGGVRVAQAETGTMTDMPAAPPRGASTEGAPDGSGGLTIEQQRALALARARRRRALATQGGAPEPAEPQGQPQSVLSGVADSLVDGLTLGYGSRLNALTSAIVGGTEEEGFWEEYDRFRAEGDARRERFRQERPYLDMAAELTGAVAPALVTGGTTAATGAAARLGRAALTATPAGMAARLAAGGTTRAGQVGRAAGSGLAAGAVYGSSEGEGVMERVQNAAIGGAAGTAGGVAGYALGEAGRRVLRRIIGQPALFDGTGLTDAGRRALQEAGIDPAQISDDFARAFAARIQQAGGQSDEALRMAVADEFGIPLTRGQATGDVAQSAFEEGSRSAARGGPALAAVRNVDEAARARVGAVADDMAGGVDNAFDVAEATGEAVRRRAVAAASARDAAYAAARESDAVIDARAFAQLGDRIKGALSEVTLTPGAQGRAAVREAMRLTDEVMTGPDGAVGVSFQAVEKLRQRMNAVFGATKGLDKREVGAAISALDDWIADSMERALISGSDEALTSMQQARGLHAAFRRTFAAQNGDEASRVIARMAEGDLSPTEIANYLYGTSKVGSRGLSVRTVRRLKGILSPEQFEAVKFGAMRRLFGPVTEEVGLPNASRKVGFGYQKLASQIKDFTTGEGRQLARELFSAEEIARMQRFERALRILVPPPEATNPSRTGYAVARLGADMMKAMAAYIGLTTGGPIGGLGAVLAAGVPGTVRNAVRAGGIPAGAARSVTRPAAAPVIGGAVAGSRGGITEVP